MLELVVKGMTHPQIASTLTISLPAAREHVSHILAKLGVSDPSEAISLLLHKKLLR